MNASTLIDRIGGTSKVAALCGVSLSAVSQWRLNGIPKAWLEFLRLAKPEFFKSEAHGGKDARPLNA